MGCGSGWPVTPPNQDRAAAGGYHPVSTTTTFTPMPDCPGVVLTGGQGPFARPVSAGSVAGHTVGFPFTATWTR